MNFSYYPGCTLKTKAKDLDLYARTCAEILGVSLDETPEWQCCGGVYSTAKDEIATKLPSVRALVNAKKEGKSLVTVCAACHNVIKRVNYDMQTNEDMQKKVNNYMQLDEAYFGETKVLHYLELLRDVVGFDTIKEKVTNPFTGRKIAAYYGCLLLRPGKEMQFDDPENPTIIEDFIRAIGGTPVVYAQRNECCGGYVTVNDKSFAQRRTDAVIASAMDMGAEEIITACPLCMYNLDTNSTNHKLPVHYFTELLAEALGVK